MNWIRIATGIMRDPSIIALGEAVGVSVPATTGHVVGVLTSLPEGSKTGDVSAVSDATLEHWAMWRGKRGAFARAFRVHLCDSQGVVRSWEKHNGAAIREVEATRERVKEWRKEKKSTGDVRRTVPVTDPVAYAERTPLRDETRRDETNSSTQNAADDVVGNSAAAAAFDSIAPCVGTVAHDALRALLTTVSEPTSWAGVIRGCASGQSMPEGRPASAERLAAAVQDFVAAGYHRATPAKVGLFRGFVTNAKASAAMSVYRPTAEDDQAEQLRTLREQNHRRQLRGEPLKPEPTWAARIDAAYPDGRTHPAGAAA